MDHDFPGIERFQCGRALWPEKEIPVEIVFDNSDPMLLSELDDASLGIGGDDRAHRVVKIRLEDAGFDRVTFEGFFKRLPRQEQELQWPLDRAL